MEVQQYFDSLITLQEDSTLEAGAKKLKEWKDELESKK